MSKQPLDLTKPYQTRDGRGAAVIAAPDGKLYGWCHRPASGDITPEFTPECWLSNGRYHPDYRESNWDLVNVPEKRTAKGWVNVYSRIEPDLLASFYSTKAVADHYRTPDCVACIEHTITYTVGEGLEP